MIPAAFDYVRADSADAAVAALVEHGDEAKLLAGGHSLLPLMKLRLAAPSVLIDIGRLQDLSYIRDAGDHIAIGGLTRHRDLEVSDLLGTEVPLLAHAAGQVGDPQVRHRGTIGGSIAHGDPASDLPAVLLALRATLVARGPDGERTIPVDDFFTGFLETALEPDRAAHGDPGAEGARARAGRSRSSTVVPRTGPSSVSPSRERGLTPASAWSTWARPRCGRPRLRLPWRAAPRPRMRRQWPTRAPSPAPTSTPAPTSVATSPGSSWGEPSTEAAAS